MDLWIRSQDKRSLVKPYYIGTGADNRIYALEWGSSYEIALGKYKTKEQAIEVLDEIQNCMFKVWKIAQPNGDVVVGKNPVSDSVVVYEMPQYTEAKWKGKPKN